MIVVTVTGVEEVSLGQLLLRAATSWPDRTACVFPNGSTTYAELWRDACEVGARLRSLGVAPGDHVGILIPNSSRFLGTFFGVAACGALPVPINPRFRGDELPYVIEHADLVALVTTGDVATNKAGERIDYLERLASACPDLNQPPSPLMAAAPKLRTIVAFGAAREPWAVAWSDHREGDQRAEVVVPDWFTPVDPAGPALMLYTSGSTSRPKGVLISADALISGAVGSMIDRLGTGHDDVLWSPLPMCHIGAFVAIVASFVVGAPFVSAPNFDPQETVELLVRERATIAYAGMSTFYYDIARELQAGNLALPHLRLLTTASNPGEIERVRAGLPSVLQVSITGSTELSGSICTSDPTDSAEQRAVTAGRPIDGVELSIRDEAGMRVAEGTVGELWVRGSCLLLGYYKDPKPLLTGAPDAGWFRTGDLAALIEGRLSFRGRLKDMIRVGGENVAAAEIENYLLRHQDIVSAAVVAAPDERLGEVPAAFVKLVEGSGLTIDEIVAFCRVGLASFKVPRVVRLVDEWPMSATKIDKQQLRQLVLA
jgi:fatty-acyl-CoA synthase